MQKTIITLCLIGLFSCASDELNSPQSDPYSVDLKEVQGTLTSTSVNISITDLAGKEINDVNDLAPDSKYKIILNGVGADFYRIKNGDGFNIIEKPSHDEVAPGKVEYTIQTFDDFSDYIYVNVVPIHKRGSTLVRERSQVFLLPQ
jgi:hypothetical protein